MFHLATDPNPAALGNWSAAHFTGTTPADKLPENGALLVSSLSVLTLEQFTACINSGIQLVSATECIDCRPHTGLGDVHCAVLSRLMPVIRGWATGKPVDIGNTMSALQAEKAAMLERMAEMVAELQSLRHPTNLSAAAIPENLPLTNGDSAREPFETGFIPHGRTGDGMKLNEGGTLPAAEKQDVKSTPGAQNLVETVPTERPSIAGVTDVGGTVSAPQSTRADGRFVRRKPTTA